MYYNVVIHVNYIYAPTQLSHIPHDSPTHIQMVQCNVTLYTYINIMDMYIHMYTVLHVCYSICACMRAVQKNYPAMYNK